MLNITQLQPSTVEALKRIYNEERNTIEFMKNYGSAYEKALALVICAVGSETDV